MRPDLWQSCSGEAPGVRTYFYRDVDYRLSGEVPEWTYPFGSAPTETAASRSYLRRANLSSAEGGAEALTVGATARRRRLPRRSTRELPFSIA